MEFISRFRHVDFAHYRAVSGRLRRNVDNGHCVRLWSLAVLVGIEDRDVRECFSGCLHCHARRRIKCWIGFPLDHELLLPTVWTVGFWSELLVGLGCGVYDIASAAECKGGEGAGSVLICR